MPTYPNNSHSAKESTGSSEKKLERVITGTAKTRKKSEVRKIASTFLPEDVASVRNYILMDVVIPGIKNAIADVVSVMLFNETGRVGGRKGGNSKISYQRCYDDRRDYGRPKNLEGFDYDDIIFETRGDADLVLDQLESVIASYGIASVADLYDLAGVTCRSYVANKYGWTDIRNAKVVRIRDGYILQLPKTVQIS